MNKKYKVFISHSSTDDWIASQIQDRIKKLKANVFLDHDDVHSGDDFENILMKELRSCNELLVLLTPWSLQRKYIWMEIGGAMIKKRRIVPVLHGVKLEEVNSNGSPVVLKKTHALELNEIEKY